MNFDRTISIIIVILIIVGLIGLVYIWVTPNEVEGYTEFYLLGQSGKAGDYPTNLTTGQKGNLTMGIVNHEHLSTSYRIKIKMNNKTLKEENITLDNNQTNNMPFEFTAGSSGQYKLEFNLYKLPDTTNIYRSLFLLINVK